MVSETATRAAFVRRPARRLPLRRLLLVYVPAGIVTLAVLLPIAYLVARAMQADLPAASRMLSASLPRLLVNSLGLAATVTLASIGLSLVVGWLTERTDLPGRRAWGVLTVLPLVVPSYVGAFLFVTAFGPRGLLQKALEPILGLDRLPEIYGFWGAFLALTLLSYPFVLIPVRAALQRADPQLEEAARSLGENGWGVVRRVILPQIAPAVAAGALLVALYCLRDFGAVSVMRFTTFTRAIYLQYQSLYDRSSAALLSLVLLVLMAALVSLEQRTRRSAMTYGSQAKGRGGVVLYRLRAWRWPAVVFCAAVVGVALILPGAVLIYWLVRAVQEGPAWGPTLAAAGNSLLVSGQAAAITLVAAAPIAVVAARYPGRWSRWVENLSHAGFALPGIVIALALVFFGIRAAPGLYQTLPMLLLAYLILFLPQAGGPLRASLLQVPRSLEEAGRGLGRGPLTVFRRVTLPLIRPGIVAAVALVFLTAMKELPATLILSPTGFHTLATEVWSSVTEAYFARAAAPALLLILLSSVPMIFFVGRAEAE